MEHVMSDYPYTTVRLCVDGNVVASARTDGPGGAGPAAVDDTVPFEFDDDSPRAEEHEEQVIAARTEEQVAADEAVRAAFPGGKGSGKGRGGLGKGGKFMRADDDDDDDDDATNQVDSAAKTKMTHDTLDMLFELARLKYLYIRAATMESNRLKKADMVDFDKRYALNKDIDESDLETREMNKTRTPEEYTNRIARYGLVNVGNAVNTDITKSAFFDLLQRLPHHFVFAPEHAYTQQQYVARSALLAKTNPDTLVESESVQTKPVEPINPDVELCFVPSPIWIRCNEARGARPNTLVTQPIHVSGSRSSAEKKKDNEYCHRFEFVPNLAIPQAKEKMVWAPTTTSIELTIGCDSDYLGRATMDNPSLFKYPSRAFDAKLGMYITKKPISPQNKDNLRRPVPNIVPYPPARHLTLEQHKRLLGRTSAGEVVSEYIWRWDPSDDTDSLAVFTDQTLVPAGKRYAAFPIGMELLDSDITTASLAQRTADTNSTPSMASDPIRKPDVVPPEFRDTQESDVFPTYAWDRALASRVNSKKFWDTNFTSGQRSPLLLRIIEIEDRLISGFGTLYNAHTIVPEGHLTVLVPEDPIKNNQERYVERSFYNSQLNKDTVNSLYDKTRMTVHGVFDATLIATAAIERHKKNKKKYPAYRMPKIADDAEVRNKKKSDSDVQIGGIWPLPLKEYVTNKPQAGAATIPASDPEPPEDDDDAGGYIDPDLLMALYDGSRGGPAPP
jgi:hypothetical protein